MIADELIKSLSQQNFKRFIEQLRLKSSESWKTCKHQVRMLRSAMTDLFLAAFSRLASEIKLYVATLSCVTVYK